MNIKLSEHFTYKKLLTFVFPSVMMMVFTSIYGVVDGFFVSNYVGKTPFAALNLIYPFVQIISAVGFMMGAGGSAIIGKTLGEGDIPRASRYFSLIVYSTAFFGILFSAVGIPFLEPISILLGADEAMLGYCVVYGRILLIGMVTFMLQCLFQSLLVTAEKPHLGFAVTVAAGVTNMFLDWLLVGVLQYGLEGAAWATVISQTVGGVIPLIYFALPNSSLLHLGKTKLELKVLLKACTNGSSELVSNISASFVGILYNLQLMKYAGEDGVAAYGVIMYVSFIFAAIFFGYAIGAAPVISYHYGAKNTAELRNLFKKSVTIMSAVGILMTVFAEFAALPLSRLFVGYDENLMEMTCRGMMIFSSAFLIAGINIFGSAFFTALNNGAVSALISFLRTLVLQAVTVLIIPLIWGLDGVWFAAVAAEVLSFAVTVIFLAKYRKKYNYA